MQSKSSKLSNSLILFLFPGNTSSCIYIIRCVFLGEPLVAVGAVQYICLVDQTRFIAGVAFISGFPILMFAAVVLAGGNELLLELWSNKHYKY